MTQTGNGTIDKTKDLCIGCRDNFYNGNNDKGIEECWLFKQARIVERYRIGWWTEPRNADSFERVFTLNCHSAPGKYALSDKLPEHILKQLGSEVWPEHLRVSKVPT